MFKTYIDASGGAGGSIGMQPLTAPSNPGKAGLAGAWQPGVLYLLALAAAEIVIAGLISKYL